MNKKSKNRRDWMYFENLFGKISTFLIVFSIFSYIIFLSFLEALRFYARVIAYPIAALVIASGISFFIALVRIIKYSSIKTTLPKGSSIRNSILSLLLSPIAFGAYYVLFFIVAFSSCGT